MISFLSIRKKLRLLLPYGIVEHRHKQREKRAEEQRAKTVNTPRFLEGYVDYCNSQKRVSLAETNPFQQVVSVQGFGYSGSGAVVDMLREYDCNRVVGFVDDEGSLADKTDALANELDILRLAGGLMEFEKYLGSNNIFQNDALLHRFIFMVEKSDLYRKLPASRPYFYEFFSHIADLLHKDALWQCYNEHLDYEEQNRVIVLKEIPIKQFRLLGRHLLYSIFNLYKGNSGKDTLVLDQLFSDYEFDMKRYLDYLPELKIIAVYRDPRDVYAFAHIKDVEWLPQNDVHKFIAWYKILFKHCDITNTTDYLVVRFEDLVNNYPAEKQRIENYLHISGTNHTKPLTAFNYNHSAENVGIWKTYDLPVEDYLKIAEELKPLCYNNTK